MIDDDLDGPELVVDALNGPGVGLGWPACRFELGERVPKTRSVSNDVGYMPCD